MMATKRELGDNLDDDIEVQKPKKIRYDRGPSGTLLFTGPTEFEYINRDVQFLLKSDFTVWDPMRLAAVDGLKVCFVSSGSSSAHMFAITEEGKVYGWGRNEKGALGVGDKKDRRCPTLIKALEDHNVIHVATGKSHSLFLTDEGRIFASGDNENGQCSGTDPVFSEDDLGDSGDDGNDDPDKKKKKKKKPKKPKVQAATAKVVDSGPQVHNDSEVLFPKEVKWDGPPAKKIACGQDFNVLLDVKGSIWTWGHPEHGVIGDNNDRQFFEKLSKISFRSVYEPIRITNFVERDPKTRKATRVGNVFIKDISCGAFHTVAIDERNRAFSWGFGGYGRLGHSETTDEPVPRLIKHLDMQRKGVTKVVAGRQFNLAFPEARTDSIQMWGQFVSNKEANMYPKPLNDLAGMEIHEIACNNKGWMAITDDGVIGAMGTTCTGEFANGERIKNSAKAVEIKTLNKFKVLKIGMSLSNTLFIVRDTGLDDQKFIKRLDILDQAEMEYE